MRTAKTLIRLGGCPGWAESLLGAHAILLVLAWGAQLLDSCVLKEKVLQLLNFHVNLSSFNKLSTSSYQHFTLLQWDIEEFWCIWRAEEEGINRLLWCHTHTDELSNDSGWRYWEWTWWNWQREVVQTVYAGMKYLLVCQIFSTHTLSQISVLVIPRKLEVHHIIFQWLKTFKKCNPPDFKFYLSIR